MGALGLGIGTTYNDSLSAARKQGAGHGFAAVATVGRFLGAADMYEGTTGRAWLDDRRLDSSERSEAVGGVVGGALLSVVGPAASWFSRRASRGASPLSDVLDGGGGRGLDDGAAGAASSGARKVPCTPCFVAGTLVLSAAGLVAIDQLQPGDVVLAREEYGEQVDWRQILATHVTEDRELVELRIESEEGLEVLITTPEHPFATPGGDWVRAGDLDVGELLVTVDGDLLHLQSSTWLAERATVFNLEVDDFHTYFVGETGVLVHNGGGPCGEVSDGLASEGLAATRASVDDKLARYLLNPDHPVGGSKAKWFESALGFTRTNADDLARQIKFDPSKAVQTAATEHGTKFNQTISITGANGRAIDVNFAWIRNNDDVVRLVTGIPAKK